METRHALGAESLMKNTTDAYVRDCVCSLRVRVFLADGVCARTRQQTPQASKYAHPEAMFAPMFACRRRRRSLHACFTIARFPRGGSPCSRLPAPMNGDAPLTTLMHRECGGDAPRMTCTGLLADSHTRHEIHSEVQQSMATRQHFSFHVTCKAKGS